MQSEKAWTFLMSLTLMIDVFLMEDDRRGSLIEIYIGLPRILEILFLSNNYCTVLIS